MFNIRGKVKEGLNRIKERGLTDKFVIVDGVVYERLPKNYGDVLDETSKRGYIKWLYEGEYAKNNLYGLLALSEEENIKAIKIEFCNQLGVQHIRVEVYAASWEKMTVVNNIFGIQKRVPCMIMLEEKEHRQLVQEFKEARAVLRVV
ncbi:hypothetical protein [Bacillus mycoides]|uniref:hypothetical protein n=1 Tax=Bacillus mycoides TaxID=1405 RepID=UPI003A7F9DC3